MIPSETAQANGHSDDAEPGKLLKREIYYDAVEALLTQGATRAEAFEQVAVDMGTTASNISGGYYLTRRARRVALTEGVDPASAIMDALQAVEEALADAKLVIASATLQFERMREDAARYAELRKMIR